LRVEVSEASSILAQDTDLDISSTVSSAQSAKSSAKSSVVVATKPHWLLRKILRKSSSSYNVKNKNKAPKPVCKSVSIADLRKIRVDVLKDKSLDELARIGGVSLLILPPGFAAAQLAIPVGICATAAYILQHGKLLRRTFRICRWLTYKQVATCQASFASAAN